MDRRGNWIVGCVALAAVVIGCRKPPEKTPEGTLGLLRQSLVTGTPPLERVADVRVAAEARVLQRGSSMEISTGVPLTARALAPMLEDERPRMNPAVLFGGARDLLREGHCEKIADARMPEFLGAVPEPRESWRGDVLALHVSVARRMTNAFAGEYRCDGGPSFTAVFVHPYPDDGTLRVAYLGPASHP